MIVFSAQFLPAFGNIPQPKRVEEDVLLAVKSCSYSTERIEAPTIGMKDSNGRESASEPSLKGNGFPKKVRTHFTAVQIAAMEKRFAINPYPTAKEREEIARVLQLHDVQIQVWFQNRRAKMRRKDRNFAQHYLTPSKRRPYRVKVSPTYWMKPGGLPFNQNIMCLGVNGGQPKFEHRLEPASGPYHPLHPAMPYQQISMEQSRNVKKECITPTSNAFTLPEQNGRCLITPELFIPKISPSINGHREYHLDGPPQPQVDPISEMLDYKNKMVVNGDSQGLQDGHPGRQLSGRHPAAGAHTQLMSSFNVSNGGPHPCHTPVKVHQDMGENSPKCCSFSTTPTSSTSFVDQASSNYSSSTSISGNSPPNCSLPRTSPLDNSFTEHPQESNSLAANLPESHSLTVHSPSFGGYYPALPTMGGFFAGTAPGGVSLGGMPPVGGPFSSTPTPLYGVQPNPHPVSDSQGYMVPVILSYQDPGSQSSLVPIAQPHLAPQFMPANCYGQQ